MKKNTLVLLILLMVLSIFTYIKLDELKNSKEYSKLLIEEIENKEKEIKEMSKNYEDKEDEFERFKLHYKTEYESRNLIDIKSRQIYDAFINQDIEYLKSVVSNNVKVKNEIIIFENDYEFSLGIKHENYVLRQRYYF